MFVKTNMSYGVNEVLLSSVLASVIFSVLAAQPLTIVGVTGTWITPELAVSYVEFIIPLSLYVVIWFRSYN